MPGIPASGALVRRLLASAALGVACSGPPATLAPGAQGSSAPSAAVPPTSRVELVASADQLAVRGTQRGGEAGAADVRAAAALRWSLWRRDRREADGLEAIELWRQPLPGAPLAGCESAVDLALAEGERSGEPARAYAALHAARRAQPGAPCAARAERAMAVLAAFRPLPTLLDAPPLGAPLPAAPSAGAAAAPPDAVGVVSPRLSDDAPASGPLRITGIEHYGTDEAVRVVIALTRAARFETGFLPAEGARPARFFLDVAGATFTGKRERSVGALVQKVRLGEQRGGTRVVLDLARDAPRSIFYLPEPFRIVVDVGRPATTSFSAAPGARRPVRRIVLDPGHGGHDPGAVGGAGLQEKDVTLDVAHRAAPLLARELGVSTLLTRDVDAFVPLAERTARANAYQADLFISIHCNASEDPAARGVMTFVLADSRDQLAASLAARENAASPAAAAELASSFGRLQESSMLGASAHFADLLQRSARASLAQGYPDVPIGGVRHAGFYVLAGAQMPAVLFETTFISSPLDEARLDTGDYRQKLADAIVNAVRAWRDGL